MPLMNRQMYFGTKELMSYVRAPQVDYDATKIGWDGGVTQFISGGAYVQRSITSHKTYNFTWTNLSRDLIRLVNDYADGVYGNGPIYFLDPFAMDKNLLPQHWALGRMALNDGPVLSGQTRDLVYQSPIAYPNTLGYPAVAARYQYDAATWPAVASRPSIYIPVPTGYTVWIGAKGALLSGTTPLSVKPDNGTLTALYPSAVTNTTRISASFDGTATMTGVTIGMLANIVGTLDLVSMIVQVLPTGTTPTTGGFISGQGNSGVRFAAPPAHQQYSAALDMQSLTAQLVEDQTWR